MTRRLLLTLTAACLAACAPTTGPGTGTGGANGPVTYEQKVKRIEAMTQALSLGQNQELQQSLQGAQTVGATMSQGAFKQTTAAATGLVAAGGGNMVAAGGGNLVAAGGGNYMLRALVEDLNRAIRHDAYHLAATAELQDGSIVTYDDATGELQAVKAPTAEATFKLVTRGDSRTWTMNLTKSPDGTVGTLSVEIAADTWVDQAMQPSMEAPPPNFDDNEEDQDAASGFEDAGEDQGGTGFGDDNGFELQQAMGDAPPVKIFGGQQPDFNTVSRVHIKADFKAQGQESLRMVVDALVDEWGPAQGTYVPARLGLDFEVASLAIKTDTRIGWAALDIGSQGEFRIRTKEAQETFRYGLAFKSKAGTGKLDLTNEGARMRFGATIKPGKNNVPETVTGLYDSDTGTKLADLVPSTKNPAVIEIRFTDGRVVQWDPASGQTMTVPAAKPAKPAKAAKAPKA